MAEGLKIIVGADVNEATQALKKVGADITKLESQVAAFGGGVKKFTGQFNASFNTLPPAIKKTENALKKLPSASDRATQSLTDLSRVAQDAPFGFLGIANNLNPLFENFGRLRQTTGSTGGALKALGKELTGVGGLGLAIGLGSALLTVFGDKLFQTSKAAEAAEDATKKYKEQVKGIFADAGKEATQVVSLIAVLKSETETRERKLAAIKELQRIQPEVFKGLTLEGNAVTGLDAAYTAYLANLRTVIAVKIKQAQLDTLIAKQLEQQGATLTASEKKLKGFSEALKTAQITPGVGKEVSLFGKTLAKGLKDAQTEAQKTQTDIEALVKDIGELSAGVDVKIDAPKKDTDTAFNKIISKAKEVSAFLKDSLFVINYEFSPLDDKATALKKAQDFLNQVAAGGLQIKTLPARVPIELSEPPPAKVEQAISETDKLLKRSILQLPPAEIPVEFTAEQIQNVNLVREFEQTFKDIGKTLPPIDLTVSTSLNRGQFLDQLRAFFRVGQNVSQEGLANLAKNFKAGIEQINNSLTGLKVEGIAAIGNAIGEAISGGNLSGVFSAFAQSVADAIQSIGKQFITLGAVAVAAKQALATLFANPFATIAAGVALVAVGAALKNIVGKGVTGFAQGGLVFGPTVGMVGEGVGTSRSNPEVIAPLDQLKSMLGDLNGGGQQVVIINGRTRGNQFELLADRTNRQNRRLGAG